MSSSKHSALEDYLRPVCDLERDTRDYVDAKVDQVKLKTIKGLSVSVSLVLSMVLLLFTVSVVLLAVAAGCILLLGKWTGSYIAGAFIMAGVFLVLSVIVFLLRKRLFVNGFVHTFAQLFFEEKEEDE